MKQKKQINLVLSGGGYKGYAHIGVIKELEKNGYEIKRIAGCSAGAIIGAMYAATKNIRQVEEYLLKANLYKLTDITISKRGLIKGEKIIKYIEEFLKIKTFKELKIPLVVNATDIRTGKEIIIRKGNLLKAIRASSAYPGVFTPEEYKGKLLLDGGIINPVPVSLLKPTRPTIISDVLITTPKLKEISLGKIMRQSLELLQQALIKKQLETISHQYVHIKPNTAGWDVFSIRADPKKIILEGEKATKKKIREIEKLFK